MDYSTQISKAAQPNSTLDQLHEIALLVTENSVAYILLQREVLLPETLTVLLNKSRTGDLGPGVKPLVLSHRSLGLDEFEAHKDQPEAHYDIAFNPAMPEHIAHHIMTVTNDYTVRNRLITHVNPSESLLLRFWELSYNDVDSSPSYLSDLNRQGKLPIKVKVEFAFHPNVNAVYRPKLTKEDLLEYLKEDYEDLSPEFPMEWLTNLAVETAKAKYGNVE